MINVEIGLDGALSTRRITLGNQWENKDETIIFELPLEFKDYYSYLIAVYKTSDGGNVTKLVPIVDNKITVTDELTRFSGKWLLYVMCREYALELDSGQIDITAKDNEHVFISNAFSGMVNANEIDTDNAIPSVGDVNANLYYDLRFVDLLAQLELMNLTEYCDVDGTVFILPDGDLDVDLSSYATKEELETKAASKHIHTVNDISDFDEHKGAGKKQSDYGEIFNDYNNNSAGYYSHAEGCNTTASGNNSHAEGLRAKASSYCSHAEGYYTTASGNYSHAEGYSTTASSQAAHSEGYQTTASGYQSHAEGCNTTSSGNTSHSEGFHTIASGKYSHVQGKYNVEDTNNVYAHIVGNGSADTKRSNAHTLDWDGNAWFAGNVTVGNGNNQLATQEYVDSKVGSGGTTGGVSDVKINDISIVTDGVANIPHNVVQGYFDAEKIPSTYSVSNTWSYVMVDGKGFLNVRNATESHINGRDGTAQISVLTLAKLDYAVKQAMCDGKGAEWTSEEKLSARNRMGFDLEPTVIEIEVTEENVRRIEITTYNDKPLSDYDFKQLWIIAESVGGLTATNNEVQIRINDSTTAGDTVYLSIPTNFTHNASKLYWGGIIDIRNGLAFSGSVGMAMAKWRSNAQATINMSDLLFEENINGIYCYAIMTNFPVGTKFKFILR